MNLSARHRRLLSKMRDGIMTLMPMRDALVIGAIGGALTILPAFPLWFLGRCVFTDSVAYRFIEPESSEYACQPIPAMSLSEWSFVVVGLIALGLLYGIIHRYSVHYKWAWHPFGIVVRAVDVLAMVTGPLLATAWAVHIPQTYGMPSSFSQLILGLSPLANVLWWRAISVMLASFYSRRASSDTTKAATIQVLIMLHFQLPTLESLQVLCSGSDVTVKGPFDAVDAERIDDLLANEYPDTLSVKLETTLSQEEYWRPYNEDLSSSGYVSPPIRHREIPAWMVFGVAGATIILILVALVQGPGIGLRAEDLRLFVSTTAGNVPEVDAVGREVLRASDELEPFEIDVEASFEVCPTLGRNALERWRLSTETRAVGANRATVTRIHGLDLKYYVFVIDRQTRACSEELEFTTLDDARRAARRYTIGSAWEEIPMHYDWRHVPPVAR